MTDIIMGFLPNKLVLYGMLITFFVPLIIYKVNQVLHKEGDPPWAKETWEQTENDEDNS